MKTKPKHEKAFMKCAEAFAECSNAGLKKLGRTDELSLEVVVYYIKFGGNGCQRKTSQKIKNCIKPIKQV